MTERLIAKLDRLGAEAGIKEMTPEIYRFAQLLNDDKLKQWDEWRANREWVGLNDDEIDYLIHLAYTGDEEFVQTIEAKLKEKNLPCIKPKWIGLTEKEHTDIAVECGCMSADWVFYGAAVERKLKERNT